MVNNKLYAFTLITFTLSSIGWLILCVNGIIFHIENKMIFKPGSPIAATSIIFGMIGIIAYITFFISLFIKPRVKKYLITNVISLVINFLLFFSFSLLFIGI